ncbi:anthrone oxygenase family protein [Actinomadura sp. 3N407]|uniref:anthrone oxygenase family protein n=1 Tax=Actinomadura sp. 3N407 TaxID=3457423 RepID=UPI003FCDDE11
MTLVVATMTTGFTASVFVHWSNTIMPALGEVDDRTFVASFHALDAAIANPLFLGVGFLGALLSTGLAAALHLRGEQRRTLMWIVAALGCYLAALVITFAVHEPLNQALRAPGELATDADVAAARARLEEARWTAWNTVRAVVSTLAFGCLTWALAGSRRWRSTAL